LSPCQTAAADPVAMPKQGTTTYATYYTSLVLAQLDMGDAGNEQLIELFGTTRNMDGQKLFDNMAVHCLFSRGTIGGKVGDLGACSIADGDADKVYTTFDTATGVQELIGGTGKYKGISGTAPNTALGPWLSWGSSVAKVTWQFR
jgi:hypothetical protein